MEKYKALILTDPSNHTAENSLYDLATKLYNHPKTQGVDVLSRVNYMNDRFFKSIGENKLIVTSVKEDFIFSEKNHPLENNLKVVDTDSYDLIWLRLPPPISKDFLDFLSSRFTGKVIINNPEGIYKTGSKEFLTKFPSVCPPLKVCRSLDDIIQFKKEFPIVLKPFRAYGGTGLVRIDGNKVWSGREKMTLSKFENTYDGTEYLGVKYLKNVHKSSYNSISDKYETISYGDVILRRSEVFESVKQKLVKILEKEWSKILLVDEVDEYKNNNGLFYFQFPDKIYKNLRANPKILKSNVKVICFKLDLEKLLHDFIAKTLE